MFGIIVSTEQMKQQAALMGQEIEQEEDTLEPPVPPPTWDSANVGHSAEDAGSEYAGFDINSIR